MPQPKPIVVVGSINLDLVTSAKRIPRPGETLTGTAFAQHPGGKGANQAVAVARLGYPVHLIGRLGDDAFAAQLRQHLHAAGVAVDAVHTSPGSSGVAAITVAASGENAIVVVPGANALLTPADLGRHVDLIRSAGIVLTQLEIPLATVDHLAEICTREQIPLVLDPSPACELPPKLLAQVTWFTPNETEATFYTEVADPTAWDATQLANDLLGLGAQGVILKQGAKGATIARWDSPPQTIPSFAVEAVDTTAAGDCFNGAFATALMLGKPPAEAVRFANAAAALSVTRRGAQPSMPTHAEVDELLQAESPTNPSA
jgi:ribokinase